MATRDEAASTLNEITRVRLSTRQLLDATWFPFLLWGALGLGSAPFTQINGGDPALGIYWLVASVVGVVLTSGYYRRRELSLGIVNPKGLVYLGLSVVMVTGAMLVGALAGGDFSNVGPILPIAAGLLAFGLLKRSTLIIASAVALVAVVTAVLAAEPSQPALVATLGEAAVLIFTGLLALARSRRHDIGGAAPASLPGS